MRCWRRLDLRGGWHRPMHRSGTVSESPKKDHHSHPGDAMSYLAAKLFPMQSFSKSRRTRGAIEKATYWSRRRMRIPKEMHTIGGPK